MMQYYSEGVTMILTLSLPSLEEAMDETKKMLEDSQDIGAADHIHASENPVNRATHMM